MECNKTDFPVFDQIPELVYVDSASSSLKPHAVIQSVLNFYQTSGVNVHRGAYRLSELASQQYESARKTVAQFIRADVDEVIFTSGTTASINVIAHSFARRYWKPGDRVLVTQVEHHSNWLIWQELAKMYGVEFCVVPMPCDVQEVERLLTPRTKLFCFPYVSNVLGSISPIAQWSALAQSAGVATLVDASQAVGHIDVDFSKLGVDFLAFSGHKMLGPTGIGVLVGKKRWLDAMTPVFLGGGMVSDVHATGYRLLESPQKWEAGTPHIAGAIGLQAAIEYINDVSIESIQQRECVLYASCKESLSSLPWIRLVGEEYPFDRRPIFSFVVDDIHAHDVATILDMDHICVRAGHHCAKPLLSVLDVPSLVRVSLSAFYNDENDILRIHDGLKRCKKVWNQYG